MVLAARKLLEEGARTQAASTAVALALTWTSNAPATWIFSDPIVERASGFCGIFSALTVGEAFAYARANAAVGPQRAKHIPCPSSSHVKTLMFALDTTNVPLEKQWKEALMFFSKATQSCALGISGKRTAVLHIPNMRGTSIKPLPR